MTATAPIKPPSPLLQTLQAMPPPALSTGAMCIRLGQLAERLGERRAAISVRLQRLTRAGLVERKRPGCYALTNMGQRVRSSGVLPALAAPPQAPGVKRPRGLHINRPVFATRLWAALRHLRKATLPQLLEVAARPDEEAAGNAYSLLAAWADFGLVKKMGSSRQPRYLLLRDLGVQAPRPCARYSKLWNPNASEFVPHPGGAA